MAKKRKKKRSLILCAIACAALLLLLSAGVYELLLPAEPAFSAQENRMLAERPHFTLASVLDGSFTDGVERYLADRFPGRDRVIAFTQELRQVGSLASWEDYARVAENDVQVMAYTEEFTGDDVIVTPRPTHTPAPTLAPTDTPAPTDTQAPTDTPAVTPAQAAETPAPTPAPTATVEPTATPVPTATPRPTKAPVDLEAFPGELRFYLIDGSKKSAAVAQSRKNLYAQSALFNAYASLLPEGGIFAMTIVPNARRANRLLSYADPQGMTSEIEPFIQAVTADNVAAFSAADILSAPLIGGEYVFFRSDMHWTPYGAHMVIEKMLAEAGENLPPYDAFPRQQEHPFLGTLYRDTRNKKMEANPDTLDILTPTHPVRVRRYVTPEKYDEVPFIDENANARDRYTVYLGGPKGNWTVIDRTDIPEDAERKTCLVISDSYGLCTMPLFAEVYDRAILYDPRYYDKNAMGSVADLIESWAVQDIYFIAGEDNIYNYPFYTLCNRQF